MGATVTGTVLLVVVAGVVVVVVVAGVVVVVVVAGVVVVVVDVGAGGAAIISSHRYFAQHFFFVENK